MRGVLNEVFMVIHVELPSASFLVLFVRLKISFLKVNGESVVHHSTGDILQQN